jgi:hypothetical protein
MHDSAGAIFLVLLIVILVVASVGWRFSRSRALLHEWADEHGFRLIDYEYRWLVRGPFFWTTSKSQTVYRVTVEDGRGSIRKGWVRCGTWLAGLWSRQVDVRWDDVPHQPGFEVVMPDDQTRDA